MSPRIRKPTTRCERSWEATVSDTAKSVLSYATSGLARALSATAMVLCGVFAPPNRHTGRSGTPRDQEPANLVAPRKHKQ